MSVPTPINYPRTVRMALAAIRAERPSPSFDEAWERVTAAHPYPVRRARGKRDDLDYVEFLRVQFCAAYNRDDSAKGRWASPGPEASAAVKPESATVVRPPRVRPAHCMSADGCKLAATHGRFGAFCEAHAVELGCIVVPAHAEEAA